MKEIFKQLDEQELERYMRYCKHYDCKTLLSCSLSEKNGKCKVDVVYKTVSTSLHDLPCIDGHLNKNILKKCPKWDRRTPLENNYESHNK
jgi:hypothetical protein